ncbi:pilus assembly protein [Vibrio sp. Vb2880]|uniref:Pilus assembly protein CpaE n=1 Tax=Vibrio furnissii TaxID=29494 RepID=A0A0Q2R216_VIBFU|nr:MULTISPECIES: TadE family protein [Vibrio]KQH86269.1 pilus assembly protein CpaE [Vibrio furnissii]MBO0214339.1 pilus assembly protein [Vibrio sp. Vb2880]MCG6232799.1 pilus assembly protein [Vibrio furnissii]MCG6258367.1 pilus assembly protein [Vibrio furnissii]WJG22137.1 pilus assembly protein [Vibrio furnissii]
MKSFRRMQRGMTLIEFTFLASVLLMILFAIMEIGMYAYSIQTINNITRKAARFATVCVVSDPDIPSLALNDGAPDGFTSANLVIEYLGADGSKVTDPPTSYQADIYYVRARVTGYSYQFSGLLSFLGSSGVVSVPDFETTLPSESLGVLRPGSSDPDDKTDC